GELNETWAAFGIEHPVAKRLLDKLPAVGERKARSKAFSRATTGSLLPDEKVELLDALRRDPKIRQFADEYDRFRELAEEAVNAAAAQGDSLVREINDLTTIGDVVQMTRFLDDANRKII